MNRRRAEFEVLRDSVLHVAGNLDLTVGGRAVDIIKQPSSSRRTLYGFIDRQNLPSLHRAFDFATPDAHCPERHQTTVPQQALYLMNSEFVQEQAALLVGDDGFSRSADKVRHLFREVLSRDPSAEELHAVAEYSSSVDWQSIAQVLLLSNEFVFVD